MIPLDIHKKRFTFAGQRAKNNKVAKTPTKKETSTLTKWNSRLYTAGQISIAMVSTSEHLNYSIPKLISSIKNDEDSFIKHEKRGVKQLRPNYKFSRDYWNSSINYGASPWYF